MHIIQTSPVAKDYYEQFRSSAIQSFEFSVDTLWKFVKDYLIKIEKIALIAPNPRSVFRECWNLNLIDKAEFDSLTKLIADRNLTSHSYNELTAEEITKRLPDHYKLIDQIIKKFNI